MKYQKILLITKWFLIVTVLIMCATSCVSYGKGCYSQTKAFSGYSNAIGRK